MTYNVPYNEEVSVSGRTEAETIAAEAEGQAESTAGGTFHGYTYDAVNETVAVKFSVESDTGPGDAYSKGDSIVDGINSATNAGLSKASEVSQGRPSR